MMNQEKKNREALKNLEPNAMKKEANANIRNQSAVSVAALLSECSCSFLSLFFLTFI